MSKQAIGTRLQDSKPFLKELLKRTFSLIYSNAIESHTSLLLKYFSDVKLLDATTISLPDQVADDYTGMGGRNAKAALKIQTLYSAINHSITCFDIISGVTHDTLALPEIIETLSEKELFLADLGYFDTSQLQKIGEKNFFISRIKTNLKLFKVISEKCSIYEQLEVSAILKKSTNSVDQEVYVGTDTHCKLKVRLVGTKLPDEVAHKRIKKAIVQNDGNDISTSKREILHWNLMITNINADVLDTTIITELYCMRWQIELLFKVLKSTFSIDKMHVAKTKYVESILYGCLIGILMTMPLYDCIDQTLLSSKGRGVSIQRFYILLNVDLYQFYVTKKVTLHTYSKLCDILVRIGHLALHEKRVRQTTYSRIEGYLEEILQFGKT